MIPFHRRQRACRERGRHQRGEGKVGCIVSLALFALLTATAIKVVPVYWASNELKDAANDLASRASAIKAEALELQLRTKARDLGIGEALVPGAIKAVKLGDNIQGTCTITIHYTRKIDLYGVFQWPLEVNSSISAPYLGGL